MAAVKQLLGSMKWDTDEFSFGFKAGYKAANANAMRILEQVSKRTT